ncbi:MAG TPA: M1 family metallopeptidase [Anaerolineae bacterium]|nr:M1 family metallopeptidase [Anaerolineae bacterium]
MRKFILILALVVTACAPIAVTQPIVPTPTRSPISGPTPTPDPVWADLSPYRAAMRPEFAQDVDQFANATQYKIDLTIAPDLTSYTGSQQVHYINTETSALGQIYFRLFPNTQAYGGQLTITSLKMNGASIEPIMELGNSAMRIDLSSPLNGGAAVDFEMSYQTIVPTTSITYGYDQFGLLDHILALPNFYPQIPAYDEEGWNVEIAPGDGDAVYSDSALYQVNISAPSNQIVAASGVCDRSSNATTQTLKCVSGPMRDFMIGMSADFQIASDQIDGIQVNSYYLARDAEAGQNGLTTVVNSIKSYEQRIGAYPFTELDLLETPTQAGGIEYPGLIVVAEDLYRQARGFQEGATAHEAAHQWWYSLVGNDQLDDPWLDESLTQFTTALYFYDQYGQSGLDGDVNQDLVRRHDRVKGTDEDKRADLPVAAYTGRQYSAIVYGKAPLFFYALWQKMGDEKYNAFMQNYFQANRYGVAKVDDLLKAIETQLDKAAVDALMKQWITTP